MSAAALWAGIAQVAALVLVLALVHRPLGDLMARIYTTDRDWRIERGIYRVIGVDPRGEQTWQAYARSVLLFSLVGVVALYGLQRLQELEPWSLGLPAVPEGVAFNTAVSFVTNTNWQTYYPESTLGYAVQAVGLTVQNFVSASVGMAIAVALIRGFARRGSATIGSFWVDLTRGVLRLLLPISVVAAVAFIATGVVQNLDGFTGATTLSGATQSLPGGPVASQEAIKQLGTNGGGFFNANSAHPFENPSPLSNLLQLLLILIIPASLPRTFGRMVGDHRQGYAIVATMGAIALASIAAVTALEAAARGSAPELAGGAMEGKDQRFGIYGSALYAAVTTLTSTGAVNSMHDSYSALGGMIPMINMMLGEVAPGGVGSGLYGMLVLAVITVFIGGLLVGRTPEYVGKKIGPREMKLASLYILVTPTLALLGTALSFGVPGIRSDIEGTSLWNDGPHGLGEVLYAFTSAANNNGSAFAGITSATPWLTAALGVAMLLGRFVPIVLVLALAGSVAAQKPVPSTAGTLPTHRPQFVGLLSVVTVVITALTYFPVLALAPLAEGLS
ncbi:potassium-transporting ATPase subunit KdpA [Microbacterium rhizophilus]|uniref:potassium-transporting ATPase subunit KdpA n=1 Tax=Microbacterium rhizophilus TaxID=3138934 RepID=UPI0031EC18E7